MQSNLDEQTNAYHPDFRAAIQERREVSAADPSAPPGIPKAQLAAAATYGSSSRVLAFDYKKILNLKQLVEIPGEMMSGILGGIKANGMIGRRGTNTNGANLSRKVISIRMGHPKMAIFQ